MSSREFVHDHDRIARIGFDEVVFAGGKSADQVSAIVASFTSADSRLLITRLDRDKFQALPAAQRASLDYDPLSRTAIMGAPWPSRANTPVAVLAAGTSDLQVSHEAVRTLSYYGQATAEYTDIGVAGLWRVMERIEQIRRASIVIVVAGMDAALVSVVGGLVSCAVIAVPTSVGYGVATGGTTALHSALASCAPGVTVVNVDNGYGAACAALRILNASQRSVRDS